MTIVVEDVGTTGDLRLHVAATQEPTKATRLGGRIALLVKQALAEIELAELVEVRPGAAAIIDRLATTKPAEPAPPEKLEPPRRGTRLVRRVR
ncbi:MAG TPA: hypothetical protein VD838_16980 [Anaeromyxobacteraceae bacterium]|nr:hypothetical protein [Anaeromyxobacteraceae bacterium]